MAEWHASEELLGRFLRLRSSQDEARAVVKHLLTGCPECSELAVRLTTEMGLWPEKGSGAAGWEQAYEEVFSRAMAFASEMEQRVALEKLRGWAQWACLEPLDPQSRFAVVRSDKAYQTFGLYNRLLEASSWISRREPAEAVDIVRLAIVVAEHLEPGEMSTGRIADLQASAWAALGNAKRIADDFEGARQAFNEAWRLLEEGTGDPDERAHLVSLEASYMKAIGEFEMAESYLEEAHEAYRSAGDAHRQGRILFQMGDIIGHVNPERGLAHIRKALALIDAEREPRLELCARHDLALFLAEGGQPDEALATLERARPLYTQFHDDLTQLRLHWLEGKIAYSLRDYAEAESVFSQVWEEFRALGLNQEVVLVTIDLAQVLADKGEPVRAADLASQCYSIMKHWGLHKDALAAWIVFQKALSHGAVMGDLFQRVSEYYLRHWSMPAKLDLNGS